ncbi:MAG: hypothetical protein HCAMLNBO_01544 [Candidatus Brocadia fulgida]|nr:hypothetical protein [Candidatus Brocadia fulgida]
MTSEAKPQTNTCPRANGETRLEPQISQITQGKNTKNCVTLFVSYPSVSIPTETKSLICSF